MLSVFPDRGVMNTREYDTFKSLSDFLTQPPCTPEPIPPIFNVLY